MIAYVIEAFVLGEGLKDTTTIEREPPERFLVDSGIQKCHGCVRDPQLTPKMRGSTHVPRADGDPQLSIGDPETTFHPARAYSCTSDAGCAYEGCNDRSCACSSSSSNCVNGFWTGYSTCNNGVWDAICVSTTYVTTTKQAETLCTVFPLCRIVLLCRVLESED